MKLQKLGFVAAVLATMLAISTTCAACTNASVTGVWGFQIGTSVGQFKADGNGNITAGSATISQNGTVIVVNFTGTYSVAGNCTGKLALNIKGGGTVTANFVLDNANKDAQIIDTTPGTVAGGTGFPEGTVACGLSGKKTTFAALFLGKIRHTASILYVAQVVLDGKGNVSGSGTFDVGGTLLVAPTITGTYAETSNCNGTIEMRRRDQARCISPSSSSTQGRSFCWSIPTRMRLSPGICSSKGFV